MKKSCLTIALLAGLSVMLGAGPAAAQSRCRVMDPTGTPLNIRSAPDGERDGTVRNGELVRVVMTDGDKRGRVWALVERIRDNQALGWVYREFISCF
jgi:hypothetical protein